MNWIQQHILIELTRHLERRYSELRPDGVEGNLFLYHLQGLMRDKLVEKADQAYRLTAKGLQLAGTLSLETGKVRQQPKILNTIICRDAAGQYVFSRWHRQPNTNLISFPHGMMHFGVGHQDMATLELVEKTGLNLPLTYRGHIYIRGVHDDQIDRHMLVHLFAAASSDLHELKTTRPEVSEPFWSTLEHLEPSQFVPGFYEIAHLAHDQPEGYIFADITVNLPTPGLPN